MNNINKIDTYRINSDESIYEIFKSHKLGDSTYSSIYLGRLINTKKHDFVKRSDNFVIIKSINVKNMSSRTLKMIMNEIKIMKLLKDFDHKNIIKCYDVIHDDSLSNAESSYDSDGSELLNNNTLINDSCSKSFQCGDKTDRSDKYMIYIVVEYCENGQFSSLLKGKKISEVSAKYYFKQIIDGIKFLHSKNILHRDIKPENILVMSDNTLKICDFGFAKCINKLKKSHTICGSPLYMAPEIYRKNGYSDLVDVWSIGMILYEMIYGIHPLAYHNDIKKLSDTVITKDIIFPCLQHISDDCVNLLKNILKRNEEERISINDIFINKWILSENHQFTNVVYIDNDSPDLSDNTNSDDSYIFFMD